MDAPPATPPEPTSLVRRVLHGAAYLGVAQYGVLAIGLVKTYILGRLVAPEIHGAVAYALSWVSFLHIFRMELREVVISDTEGNPARLTTQYVIEVLSSLAGVALGGIVYAVAPGVVSTQVWQAIFVLLVVRVIYSATSTPLYMLHRDIRQDVITRLTLAGALIGLVVSVLLALRGDALASLLVDAALPSLLLGVGAWIVVGWRPARLWDPAVARDVAGFALTMWTGGLFSKVSFELDDWLVGRISGEEALGFYAKAYTLAKMPMDVFAGVIGGIALSVYAQSYAAGESTARRAYRQITWLLMRVVAWSSVVMLAAAEEIVRVMLGPNWQPVPLLVRAMFVYVLGRPLFQNNAQFLIALRHEKQYRSSQLIQAIALALLAPVAVYLWGALGASLAVNVMMLLGFGLSQWYVLRHVRSNLLQLYGLPLLLTIVLTPLIYQLGGWVTAQYLTELPLTPVTRLLGGVDQTVALIALAVKGVAGTLLFGGLTLLFERPAAREVLDLVRANFFRTEEPPAA